MSSKKTPYLNLHDWTGTDPWRLAEISENFKKVDTKAQNLDETMDATVQSANNAVSTANAAKNTADSIDSKATEALSNSNSAVNTASNAIETADLAAQDAGTALETANEAKTTADTVRGEFDQVVAEAGSNNPEVVQARGTAVNLNARLTGVDQQLADKASKTELQAIASGSPKGAYATLADLTTAFPSGNTSIYVVNADGKWYFWNGSAWTAGGVYQSAGIADNTVTPASLSDDIKTKGFPFAPTAKPHAAVRSAILDIKMYNADSSKLYTMAVLIRNNVDSVWSINIYEWVNGAFGAKVCEWRVVSYTPTATQEVVRAVPVSPSTIFADITVDWSKVPDGTSVTTQSYTTSGLHLLSYINRPDPDINITSKINTSIEDQIKGKRYPFQKDANPPTVMKKGILDIKLYNGSAAKSYALAVVQRNVSTLWSLRIYEWVNGAFGAKVCEWNTNNYVPTSNREIIRIPAVAPSILTADILVDWGEVPDGTNIASQGFSTAGLHPWTYSGVKDWSAEMDSRFNALPKNAPATTGAHSIKNVPTSSVLENTQTLDMLNSTVSALSIKFNKQDKNFNLFGFPARTVSAAKFVFCIIRTASGTVQKYIKEYKGAGTYYFVTHRIFNLNEDVQIVFGYCDENLLTVKQGSLPLASSVADPNLNGTVIQYIEPDKPTGIDTTPINAGNANWKSTNYYLKYLDYGSMAFMIDQPAVVPTSVQPQQFDMVLPPKIYLPSNKELWLYHSSAVENEHVRKKKPVDVSVASKSSDGATTYTDTLTTYHDKTVIKGNRTHDVTFNFRDWSKSDLTSKVSEVVATRKVSVLSKTVTNGKTFNTLMIGDSYLDIQWGDGVFNHLKAMATADGNTMNFKGTRTSYGNLGEARASWAESTFYSRYVPTAQRIDVNGDPTSANMSSPFVFSPDDTVANAAFDFAQYLSTNAITGVDNIVLFLGMNGGDGSKINLMIANIKATLPNVNIFVCMIPPAEEWRLNNDSIVRQNDRITRNKNYLSLFQNREAEKIYLVPVHANFHRVASLNNTQTNLYQFADVNNATETVVNDHHPNNLGAKGIAYLIYSYLCYAN